MGETIDLTGLEEEDIRFLKRLVNYLRARGRHVEDHAEEGESVIYHSWALGVKGKVTRAEIYDYL